MKGNYKLVLVLIVSMASSYFIAFPIGRWFASEYYGSGEFFIGPFRGFLDGFFISYIFISSILVYTATGNYRFSIYSVIPVIIFDLVLQAFNPQLWMHLVLLAAGLLIAHLFLLLTRKAGTKLF